MSQSILIMDIDHTVSDAFWRDGMMAEAYRVGNWDEYNRSAANDAPLMDVIKLVRDLYAQGWRVVACTARDDKWRKLTVDWFLKQEVPFDELLMRPEGDRRPSPELKVALIKERFGSEIDDIVMVLDDRADVVEAFKAIGITAFQIFAKMGKNNDGQRQLRAEHRGSPLNGEPQAQPAD